MIPITAHYRARRNLHNKGVRRSLQFLMTQPVKQTASQCYIEDDVIFSAELWFSTWVYISCRSTAAGVLCFCKWFYSVLAVFTGNDFTFHFPLYYSYAQKGNKLLMENRPCTGRRPCAPLWPTAVMAGSSTGTLGREGSVALHDAHVSNVKTVLPLPLSLFCLALCYLGLQGYVIPPRCTVTVPLLRESYLVGSQ